MLFVASQARDEVKGTEPAGGIVKKEIWSNYFDIVILPPREVRDHAIELSRELHEAGGVFTLGTRSYLPHISLYHIPVRPADFVQFSREVSQVASRSAGGELRLRSVEFPLLMTDKPAWLRRLHLDTVNSTLRYFDRKYGAEKLWKIAKIPARFRTMARLNLEEFGSPMIGSVFRPHITLTTFDEKPPKIPVKFNPLTFAVREIAICELGPHHSCQRVVESLKLGRA